MWSFIQVYHKSSSQSAAVASLGIRQSPLSESDTDPTFGPSGRQLLSCIPVSRSVHRRIYPLIGYPFQTKQPPVRAVSPAILMTADTASSGNRLL